MPKVHVPELPEFQAQLLQLLGKSVKVSETKTPNRFGSSAQAAIYVLDDDHLAAMMRFDLPISASMGAVLAMIPESIVKETIEDDKLDGDLLEAFSEVVNIMAALLCEDAAPHVRLASVNKCDPELKEEFLSTLQEPCSRMDLAIEIDEYPGGHLTLWTAHLS